MQGLAPLRVYLGSDPNLELEVHAFDADRGLPIGCAVLRQAERSGVRYAPHQPFGNGIEEYREVVRDDDVVGRSFVMVVVEIDDAGGCPALYAEDADVIGVSPVISDRSMMEGISLSFDRVTHLRVGVEQ